MQIGLCGFWACSAGDEVSETSSGNKDLQTKCYRLEDSPGQPMGLDGFINKGQDFLAEHKKLWGSEALSPNYFQALQQTFSGRSSLDFWCLPRQASEIPLPGNQGVLCRVQDRSNPSECAAIIALDRYPLAVNEKGPFLTDLGLRERFATMNVQRGSADSLFECVQSLDDYEGDPYCGSWGLSASSSSALSFWNKQAMKYQVPLSSKPQRSYRVYHFDGLQSAGTPVKAFAFVRTDELRCQAAFARQASMLGWLMQQQASSGRWIPPLP